MSKPETLLAYTLFFGLKVRVHSNSISTDFWVKKGAI
jgi:hypothetical protein